MLFARPTHVCLQCNYILGKLIDRKLWKMAKHIINNSMHVTKSTSLNKLLYMAYHVLVKPVSVNGECGCGQRNRWSGHGLNCRPHGSEVKTATQERILTQVLYTCLLGSLIRSARVTSPWLPLSPRNGAPASPAWPPGETRLVSQTVGRPS